MKMKDLAETNPLLKRQVVAGLAPRVKPAFRGGKPRVLPLDHARSATKGHRVLLPQLLTRKTAVPFPDWGEFLLTVRRRGWRSQDAELDLILERNHQALEAKKAP